jgi:CheY-like chemotaxis protein
MSQHNDILLINRDKYFLKQTADMLAGSGHTVHTAMEMRGALSVLSGHPIGLIICDKALEDISGDDFLSFIKKDPLRENIPFMFFVSLNDQGRPLKSFQLGAVDYVVHPINPEALIERIKEAFDASVVRESAPSVNIIQPPLVQPAPQAGIQPPENLNTLSVMIELSRDGVIWMPGKVKKYESPTISVETALFGKTGVSLMLRFKQAEVTFVVNGRIKDISFNDFQKPAGLEIEVESDETSRIHEVLKQAAGTSRPSPAMAEKTASPVEADHQYQDGKENPEISFTTLLQKKEKKATYDMRFYQSLIGKQLDNYRAITFIGAGNMGGVLQGWDVALEREVALKIISYELSSKEQFREMFIKEARVVSRLNHPNIAHIYHIGSCNDILYYAMEFVEGVTLKSLIFQKGPLTPLRGLDFLSIICNAFETVFQNSIVHRDVKPANIMISRNGGLKIVDFGVAQNVDMKTKGADRKNVMGSPLYMSPEQIAGLVIDHRSDMYSLGVTFYHALSGSPPFNADRIKDILNQHLNSPIPPLSNKKPNIPQDLSRIIEKMMAKDPGDRYDRFNDIVSDLKQLRPRMSKQSTPKAL